VQDGQGPSGGGSRSVDRGAFYDVYKYFNGYGRSETIYSNAIAWELGLRGHQVERELRIAVSYKGRRVGKQRLDLVVDRTIIVETKATELLAPAPIFPLLVGEMMPLATRFAPCKSVFIRVQKRAASTRSREELFDTR
jgi:GxxExxY protein